MLVGISSGATLSAIAQKLPSCPRAAPPATSVRASTKPGRRFRFLMKTAAALVNKALAAIFACKEYRCIGHPVKSGLPLPRPITTGLCKPMIRLSKPAAAVRAGLLPRHPSRPIPVAHPVAAQAWPGRSRISPPCRSQSAALMRAQGAMLAVYIVDITPARRGAANRLGQPAHPAHARHGLAPPGRAPANPRERPGGGFGPCGIFAALVLAQMGFRPIVLERGGKPCASAPRHLGAQWRGAN